MADFKVSKSSVKEAKADLTDLRSGRGGGGRRSMYEPVLEEVRGLKKGEVVSIEGIQKNRVQGVRAFLNKRLANPEDYVIKSAREKGDADTYRVVIGYVDDFS